MLLTCGGVMKSNVMTRLQQLATYIAAFIHDFQHGGVNNDFLVKTFHPLAMMYNDISPLENHHLAAAAAQMHQPHHLFLPVSYPHTCMLPCLPCSCASCFCICISQGRAAHVPACELATCTCVLLCLPWYCHHSLPYVQFTGLLSMTTTTEAKHTLLCNSTMQCYYYYYYTVLYCVVLCYAMLCYVMLCYVMLCHVMLCYAMLCHVMSCHVMSCHVMSCHVMSCHVMSYYVMHRQQTVLLPLAAPMLSCCCQAFSPCIPKHHSYSFSC